MSRGFANPLTELAEFEELQQSLKKKQGPVQVSGCLDSQKVHLMQETMADRPWKLVVTYDDARAREIWLFPGQCLAVSGEGSAVLQRGYPRQPDHERAAAGAAPSHGG